MIIFKLSQVEWSAFLLPQAPMLDLGMTFGLIKDLCFGLKEWN
jgi:hypothetical protein